jgi:site-specific recombinase XerD
MAPRKAVHRPIPDLQSGAEPGPDTAPDGGPSIADAAAAFLDIVGKSHAQNTHRTYRNGLQAFLKMLTERKIDPQKTAVRDLREDQVSAFTAQLKDYTPATERLYLTAVTSFYQFLAAEDMCKVNLPRIAILIQMRARKPGVRLPQFPREAIEKVLEHAQDPLFLTAENEVERLINLRDRAFLITLADTGLRVHEACGLRRSDIDWNEGRAVITIKGGSEAVVRFSERAMNCMRAYLAARAKVDGASGRPLSSLPMFARHDPGAGKVVKAITTTTGRNIVAQRVEEALGTQAVGTITPHSFRHYFVTTVLRGTGNLKMAQELARHKNIAVTTRYAHLSDDELDAGYHALFNDPQPPKTD